jgi:pSer/pThr/pTyr-binding forkhead associated (FHA) protein
VSANPPGAQSISDEQARVEAERSGRPFLLYRDQDGRQQVFLFAPGSASASVGRQRSSDLVLGWDDQISRLHARFERVEDAWVLVDDGLSSNGTFVNEERVSGRRRLNDGDAIRFGRTAMTFRSPEPARDQPARAVETPPAVSLSTTQRRVLAALCQPYKGGTGFASPATDEQIAEELFLSVGEVKAHLRVLYAKLGVEELPQSDTRVRLVERAFTTGAISEQDL